MSLFGALEVSGSGMAAQRTRAELLVENMANAETTRTPEGGPYKRKDAVFMSAPLVASFASLLEGEIQNGVGVSEIVEDTRAPDKRYLPGHPDADPEGYVAFPRINPAEDMVDLLNASRSYQGNIAAMTSVKDMLQRSIDLLR